ncbi:hypothetical protein TELCIR_11226 [Teladorsagia circumcincta]|uniref:Protein kinase domain-containing protein n=1 Tax=Teladorsagia circumcincta TaxID=45464 RepID=A0A2G9UA13_TELCI|nr:hypothetical protein TELCIR_11226 [Teladorsagia circumcincta]
MDLVYLVEHIRNLGGPLDVYLLEHKSTIDKDEKLQIVMGVAWGLEYLHSKSVLHRDIAAKNCLYDTAKVCGFTRTF